MMKWILMTLCVLTQLSLGQVPDAVKVRQLGAGSLIPEIAGTTLEGNEFSLGKDYAGQVVLVDFWATWCGPCIKETPNIKKVYEQWKDKGFKVVAVNCDNDRQKAIDYRDKKGLEGWTHLHDGLGMKSPLLKRFGISGIPQIMLIGRDGRIFANNLRGGAISAAVKRAMEGSGIADPSKSSNGISAEAQASLEALKQELENGTPETSLKALKKLFTHSPLPRTALAELSAAYGCRIDGKIHAETIYLAADAALSGRSINARMQQTAGAARAHAAIELGGPYLVELTIESMKRLQADDLQTVTKLRMHQALRGGDTDKAVDSLMRGVRSGSIGFIELKSMLKQLGEQKSPKLAQLRHWLAQRENQPSDRVQIKKLENGLLEISYQPRATVFHGSLDLNIMLKYGASQFFSKPMSFKQGVGYTLTVTPPKQGEVLECYFIDSKSVRDSNAGKYWHFPSK